MLHLSVIHSGFVTLCYLEEIDTGQLQCPIGQTPVACAPPILDGAQSVKDLSGHVTSCSLHPCLPLRKKLDGRKAHDVIPPAL